MQTLLGWISQVSAGLSTSKVLVLSSHFSLSDSLKVQSGGPQSSTGTLEHSVVGVTLVTSCLSILQTCRGQLTQVELSVASSHFTSSTVSQVGTSSITLCSSTLFTHSVW